MVDRPTAETLVHAVEQAMTTAREVATTPVDLEFGYDLDDREYARATAAALLRELAGHPESGLRHHGCHWSPASLRILADQIEEVADGE